MDRGQGHRAQKREGEAGDTAGGSGLLSTVLHSAALLPPSPAPATCSMKCSKEKKFGILN